MPNFEKQKSKVKVLVYMMNGSSQTHYSFISEDKKGVSKVIQGMTRRLLFGRYNGKYNTAIFYDNTTGEEIQKWVRGVRES